MTLRRKPKRLPGDNPLLYERFLAECRERAPHLPTDAIASPFAIYDRLAEAALLKAGYRTWLRRHGIDPDTGKMTAEGFTLFRSLVEEQNEKNRTRRSRRVHP